MQEALMLHPPFIQAVRFPQKFHTTVDALRLDVVHPVVSGNKWYKLRPYLEDAGKQNKKAVLTFGGAYSNHIVATAAACSAEGLQSIGVIRGERPDNLSATLQDAERFGMQLFFVSRTAYRSKEIPEAVKNRFDSGELYVIPEGGYGRQGSEGAAEILSLAETQSYTHIVAACGTGTMLSGLINAALPQQHLIGISILKGHTGLEQSIRHLLHHPSTESFRILHDYHFGGYAQSTPELFAFMNDLYASSGIPTDFVYTGKLFYAVHDLLQKDFFPSGSKVLIIHSGGLQGNRSLAAGTLIY